MKRRQAIGNTSDINRYGMKFSPGALWSGYEQSWATGLPTHAGHDLHAIVGWSVPLALYFSPVRTAFVLDMQMPENKDEEQQLWAMACDARQRRLDESVLPHLAALKAKLGAALTGAETMEHVSCAALSADGLARRRFPEFFEEEDDDGLVPLNSLQIKAPGVFEKDGLLLFAHPYLRRSLSRLNTLNTPFLAAFQGAAMPGCVRKIRLDPDMVGLADTFRETIELAYWRGPMFKDDLPAIPKGVTQHVASDVERLLNGISRTEFRWHELQGERSFECEELRNTETFGAGAGQFGCRFIHSMLNRDGRPDHADGAIRMYDEEAMVVRLGKDLARSGKQTDYTKLWRVDGELPVPLWKELIAHYYRDNTQVGEYLGGDHEPAPIQDAPPERKAAVSPSLPLLLEEGDGVHVTAFLCKADDAKDERTVTLLAWDGVSCGEDHINFYEADAADVIKALCIAGIATVIPADAARVDWGDEVFNLPSLLHAGPNAKGAMVQTLTACREMFARWRSAGSVAAVTVTVGLTVGEVQLWMSCAGRLGPMLRWLGHPAMLLPASLAEMKDWCNRAQGALRGLFPDCKSAPGIDAISALIRSSGSLRFRRMLVEPGSWQIEQTDLGSRIVAVPPRGAAAEYPRPWIPASSGDRSCPLHLHQMWAPIR